MTLFKTRTTNQRRDFILYFLFLMVFSFYVRFIIDLTLYPLLQPQEFFTHYSFFQKFLTYPGGLVEYCSRFLSVICIVPWLGTSAAVLLIGIICLLTARFFKSQGMKVVHPALVLVPAILIAVLYGDYGHRFAYAINLILALSLFILYRRLIEMKPVLHSILPPIVTGFLFYAGGFVPFVLFLLMAWIHDLLCSCGGKRVYGIVLNVICAVFIPVLCYDYLFMGSAHADFKLLQETWNYYKTPVMALLPILFYPVCMAACPLVKKWFLVDRSQRDLPEKIKSPFVVSLSRWSLLPQAILIGFFFYWAHYLSFNNTAKTLGLMQRYSDENRWDAVIALASKVSPRVTVAHLMRNRALYHTGTLLDRLFDYPQIHGIDGLVFRGESNKTGQYIPYSDIAYDMGEINQSLRWCYELIANFGCIPFTLKRIAQINCVKGNYETVEKMAGMLAYTPFHSRWSRNYRELITDHERFRSDRDIIEKRSLLPEKLYTHSDGIPHMIFLINLFYNKKNKMAYEYLMAAFMLDNDLEQLSQYARFLSLFGYPSVPKHLQEALFMYACSFNRADESVKQFGISPETAHAFGIFTETLSSCKGAPQRAMEMLKPRFRNTFWYYQQFIYPELTNKRTDSLHFQMRY